MTLEFPAPSHPWSLNAERTWHWAKRNRHVKLWREAAWAHAKQAGLEEQPPCSVRITLPVRDRRRRDPANYLPPAKAAVDGLVDAGLWPDDSAEWVTVEEPRLTVGGLVVVQLLGRF